MTLKELVAVVPASQKVKVEWVENGEVQFKVASAVIFEYTTPELENNKVVAAFISDNMLKVFTLKND